MSGRAAESRQPASFLADLASPSACAERMDQAWSLMTDLYPICRSITGDGVRRTTTDEDARGPHVVPDVDEERGEITAPPEHAREHEQPRRFGENREQRVGAVHGEARDGLGHHQHHEDEREEPEQLAEIAETDVRLQIGGAHLHGALGEPTPELGRAGAGSLIGGFELIDLLRLRLHGAFSRSRRIAPPR